MSPLTLEYPDVLCTTVNIVDDGVLESFFEDFTVDVIGTSIVGGADILVLPSLTANISDNEGI